VVIAQNKAFQMARRADDTSEFDEDAVWDLGQRAGWGQTNPEMLARQSQRRQRLRAAIDSLDAVAPEIILPHDS
jgi:hypothetical protein